MNFFAHAFLAAERRAEAAFVLGAMLPDLWGFARARPGATPQGPLGEGVRFHYASDAAFHAHPVFLARCARLSAALESRGVRRGPARGAAHVANELLLDGWLACERGVPRAFRDALGSARELLRAGSLEGAAVESIAAVCDRLGASPLPEAYADGAFVCERVTRALAARTFLALGSHEQPLVRDVVAREAPLCSSWAPSVLSSLGDVLGRESETTRLRLRASVPAQPLAPESS